MSDLKSMFFYIFMFLTSMLFLYFSEHAKSKIKKNILLAIGLGIPILISGLRWEVGTDFNTYKGIYNAFDRVKLSSSEILFISIIRIAKVLGDVQYLFIIYAILTIFFIYKAIKNNQSEKNVYLVMGIYLFLHFTTSFNIMRQALAAAIVLYSYRYIFEKNFLKFFLLIILASLTHNTALLCLPIYFIVPKKDRELDKLRITQIFSILFLIIIVMNFRTTMNLLVKFEQFERYSAYTQELNSRNFSVFIGIAMTTVFIIFRKKLIEYDSKNNIYIIFIIMGIILNLSGFYSPFVKRISIYFTMSQIYLLGSLPNIASNKNERIVINFFIILYIISMFVVSTYVLRQANVIPYKMCLFN